MTSAARTRFELTWLSFGVGLLLAVSACSNREGAGKTAVGGTAAQSGSSGNDGGGTKGKAGAGSGGASSAGNGGSSGAGGTMPEPFATNNLLLNGDAEDGTDSWTPVGQLGVGIESYGADGYPAVADPGPAVRGVSFFDGADAAAADSHQSVDLSPFTAHIAVGARFTLAGYLGGYLAQDDRASLVLHLLAADGSPLSTVTLGGPDASERIGATGLFAGSLDGKVPPSTQSADVHIVMTRAGGTGNDGYVDNVSLVLHN